MIEAATKIMSTLSLLSFITATHMWTYRFGYDKGHGIGKHIGFTEGLWKANERAEKRNQKSYMRI